MDKLYDLLGAYFFLSSLRRWSITTFFIEIKSTFHINLVKVFSSISLVVPINTQIFNKKTIGIFMQAIWN